MVMVVLLFLLVKGTIGIVIIVIVIFSCLMWYSPVEFSMLVHIIIWAYCIRIAIIIISTRFLYYFRFNVVVMVVSLVLSL